MEIDPFDPNEVEARKEAQLTELLAKGWRREDLSWLPPQGGPRPRPAELTTRIVHQFDSDKGTFQEKNESLTPERAEYEWQRHQKFEERRARGMWTIKHEAVMRRTRERVAATFEMARAALARKWPAEAEAMHAALTAVSERYERKLTKDDGRMLLDQVDAIAAVLPPEAAEIVRLAKLSYVGEPGSADELHAACARLGG